MNANLVTVDDRHLDAQRLLAARQLVFEGVFQTICERRNFFAGVVILVQGDAVPRLLASFGDLVRLLDIEVAADAGHLQLELGLALWRRVHRLFMLCIHLAFPTLPAIALLNLFR